MVESLSSSQELWTAWIHRMPGISLVTLCSYFPTTLTAWFFPSIVWQQDIQYFNINHKITASAQLKVNKVISLTTEVQYWTAPLNSHYLYFSRLHCSDTQPLPALQTTVAAWTTISDKNLLALICNLGTTDTCLAVRNHYPLFHPAKEVQDQGANIQLRSNNKSHSTKKSIPLP